MVTFPSTPTHSYDLSHELTGAAVAIEVALICLMLPIGAKTAFVTSVVTTAVGLGASHIYFHVDQYYAADDEFQYVKSEVQFYVLINGLRRNLGEKLVWTQKKGLDSMGIDDTIVM